MSENKNRAIMLLITMLITVFSCSYVSNRRDMITMRDYLTEVGYTVTQKYWYMITIEPSKYKEVSPKVGEIYKWNSPDPFDNFCIEYKITDIKDGYFSGTKSYYKDGILKNVSEGSDNIYILNDTKLGRCGE